MVEYVRLHILTDAVQSSWNVCHFPPPLALYFLKLVPALISFILLPFRFFILSQL